jgi:ABC-type phosphate transport system substrate-binding protein
MGAAMSHNKLHSFALTRLLAWTIGLAPAATATATELVIIVSADSQLQSLRADQVADIYLGQAVRLPDGEEAVALDQRVGSPLRDEFYSRVTGKTPSLVKAYWTKMVFTGRAQPPKEVAGSAGVRKLVADNPGMIGYVEKSALDPSVRAVLVLP